MKIMALYLPAFHRIPENDEWWGEGFTEWDNVRAGKPLYPGHAQPVEPLDDWYYDLSDISTLQKQADYAKRYSVSGFVMYHYWFGNGRMLFEKPAELLRVNPGIDIEYSFCWANDTWKTTWHGLEPKELIRQEYPGEPDWQAHIDYLMPFFSDRRYSKVGGMPVLYIYKPNEIPHYEEMLDCWNRRARKAGFEGLYIVEFISSKNRKLSSECSSAVVEFEPLYTMFFDISNVGLVKRALAKKFHRLDYQSYDVLWESILKRDRTYSGKPIILGCNCSWDNSPRKGMDSMIVRGSSPEKFETYLSSLLLSTRTDASKDFILINAWNEWSEGAYLEPDKQNGFGYLEAIRRAVTKAGAKSHLKGIS